MRVVEVPAGWVCARGARLKAAPFVAVVQVTVMELDCSVPPATRPMVAVRVSVPWALGPPRT
ncbi:MAG: hypothetical protein M3O15_00895 [Acidobacteriota bacterium]|nr:hypothetical protein [Acidobacteriota bacterium]